MSHNYDSAYQYNEDADVIQLRSPYIIRLQRELFYLWGFLAQEGLWEEANDFMDENRGRPTPFEEI